MRTALALAALLAACSAPERGAPSAPEDPGEADPASSAPAPEPTAEPASEPAPEPGPSAAPRCAADDDCVIAAPCCGCPRIEGAMHRAEAEAEAERCRRVRCAACALEPPERPPTVARCVEGACVERPAPPPPAAPVATPAPGPTGPTCRRDADCGLHTACCACPPVVRAAHVRTIAESEARCARRVCPACRTSDLGLDPEPTGARCVDGACVTTP